MSSCLDVRSMHVRVFSRCLFISLLLLASVGLGSQDIERHLDAVYVEECSPGRYFWKEDNPEEFYACVEPIKGAEGGTNVKVSYAERGGSAKDHMTNSIRMRCNPGTVMCIKDVTAGGEQMFQPCLCRTETMIREQPDRLDLQNSRQQSNELSHVQPQEQRLPLGHYATLRRLDGDIIKGDDNPLDMLDPNYDSSLPHEHGALATDPDLIKHDPTQIYHDMTLIDHDLAHLLDNSHAKGGISTGEEETNNNEGLQDDVIPVDESAWLNFRGIRKFGKQATATVSTKSFPSLPADGCPNLFRRHPNSHMFQGVTRSLSTLILCQQGCLETRNCLGVDWNKLSATNDSERCFFIFPESTRYGVQPSSDLCCDHYRRTYCLSTAATTTSTTSIFSPTTTTASPSTSSNGTSTAGNASDTTTATQEFDYMSNIENVSSSSSNDIGGFLDGYNFQRHQNFVPTRSPARHRSTPATRYHGISISDIIPDTGCPYTFQKFVDYSHPFGKNITNGAENDAPEACKSWCLVRSYCIAVDFNFATSTCYFLREVNNDLLLSSAGVTHFQKTECSPPLKCWTTSASPMVTSLDARVTDTASPSTDCQGICFVRQTLGTNNVIERGCEITRRSNQLGCFVDGTANSNFRTISCYCDTHRCNGLSIEALVSQLLYLPLDGDYRDHSGNGRHGNVPAGENAPSFTCLDKSINCSALFTGNQCVVVPSLLAASTLGPNRSATHSSVGTGNNGTSTLDSVTTVAPTLMTFDKATFAVYYKRVPSVVPQKQGVFGNSASASVRATWGIFGDNLTDTSTAGVITDRAVMAAMDDFRFSPAIDNRWHLTALSYNGLHSPLPSLQYFIDGVEMVGNTQLEDGFISMIDQPVTLGCVEGQHFIGFIDDARIFSTNLDRMDIGALLAMHDSNFW